MYIKLKFFYIFFLFVCGISLGYSAEKTSQELQLLIDVSGSMKQSDPKNLRIPAAKLLVNLLPEGTKAGIWLFAENTLVLVKTGIVDKRWKNNALSKLNKIHSSGLFTDIEKAIETSAKAWFDSKAIEQQSRHLILLTDGVVDISKDIMQSAESRERVLVDQIALLQQANIQVQTIALSDNADSELLDRLAFDTNGWSETAQTAEQLQKVFLNIFKKSVPQDSVPIKGNVFSIDQSIKEFSVLIFKKKSAPTTQLIDPEQNKILSTNQLKNITWLNEKNYDLVTIKNPISGNWKIVADMDPDNQVMIVTDLKFQVDKIANHIAENQAINLTAYFTDQQQLISREEFLNLIKISIELEDEKGKTEQWEMKAVTAKAGLFNQTIGSTLSKGKYSIKVIADAKTFQRENIQTITVVENLIAVETKINKTEQTVNIKLIPDITILNTEKMTVQAIISQKNYPPETIALEKKQGQWEFTVKSPEQGKSKVVNFSIMAKTLQGNSVSPGIKPVVIDDKFFSPIKTIADKVIDISKPEIPKAVEPETEEKNQDDKSELDGENEETESVNWLVTSLSILAINLVVFGGGFFLYKTMKKKSAAKQAQLLDRLEQ
ncbi:MAG: VWA domain-containing protein [Methylococcales bacterium]|nr:VWA domain-containing protein [Methylococcales bacterium]